MSLTKLCRKGLHELTPENTYVPQSGKHLCRACRKLARRRAYNKRVTGFPEECGRLDGLGNCLICGIEWRQEDIVIDPNNGRRMCRNCIQQNAAISMPNGNL